MNHVRSGGQIESRASRLERKHKESHRLIFLKAAHQVLAALHRSFSMKHQPWASEDRAQKGRQRSRYLAKLREDQHLLLPGRDHFCDVAQTGPLAAIGFAPGAVAKPLRGVIADLLEAHQERKNQPLAANPLGRIKLLGEVVHRLLIEGGLLAAELAKGLYFGLVRQIGDHRLVGLQPPQNTGAPAREAAHRDCGSGRRGAW